jgi:hypothetical protein
MYLNLTIFVIIKYVRLFLIVINHIYIYDNMHFTKEGEKYIQHKITIFLKNLIYNKKIHAIIKILILKKIYLV